MKKVVRYLLISSFVLPILTFTKASANDDHGQHNAYGLYDRERSRDELLRNRYQEPQSYIQRLEEHRMLSRNRFGSPSTPPSYGGGGTPSYGGDPGSNGGGSAPIDGGISLLLAAGLGLGVKKAFNRNKASKKESSDAAE